MSDPGREPGSDAVPDPPGVLDLPDVNVLVALVHPGHVHHEAALEWLAATSRFATTPVTESGLVRLAINPAITGGEVTASDAAQSLRSVREHVRAVFLPDDSSLAAPGIDLIGLVGFRQVTDWHLVNLAAAHSARLVTFDAKIRATLTPKDQHLVVTLG